MRSQFRETVPWWKKQLLGTGMLLSVAAAVVVVNTPRLRAQSPATGVPPLAFEAASVKMNKSGEPQAFDKILPGGRYTATNISLPVLIRLAHERSPRSRGLAPFEVVGGPRWVGSDRFDINATALRNVSLTELRLMLQTLLAERFQLKTHYEKRQLLVYRMVLAQRNRLGPQLRRAEANCASATLDTFRGITPGESYPCGYFGASPTIRIDSDRAYQAIGGMTMEDFALNLYPCLGRRVIDGTGLWGTSTQTSSSRRRSSCLRHHPGRIRLTDESYCPSSRSCRNNWASSWRRSGDQSTSS